MRSVQVIRKPFQGNVASCVIEHSTSGIDIQSCRVGEDIVGWNGLDDTPRNTYMSGWNPDGMKRNAAGRFPANLILGQSCASAFPDVKAGVAVGRNASPGNVYGNGTGLVSQPKGEERFGYRDSGSAARFFYAVTDVR